jgi:hypothetical protein
VQQVFNIYPPKYIGSKSKIHGILSSVITAQENMSLCQFIAARKILRSFDIFDFVKDSVTLGWKEVAILFGLHDDVFEDPRHKKIEKPVTAI